MIRRTLEIVPVRLLAAVALPVAATAILAGGSPAPAPHRDTPAPITCVQRLAPKPPPKLAEPSNVNPAPPA